MLTEQIHNDLKAAMKAKDEVKTLVLRQLIATLKNKRIELQHDLSDQEAIKVLQSLVKQYTDAITDFERGGRVDLVAKSQAEIAIVKLYLPEELSDLEVAQVVEGKIKELNAFGTKDFGRVMKAVTQELGARASGELVSRIVRTALG